MTNDTKPETHETDAWPEFRAGEVLVAVSDELLWRQIHPNHVAASVVNGLAFEETVSMEGMTGTEKGRDEVSTNRSGGLRGITAQAAYDAWLAANGKTIGTFAVTTAEVDLAGGRVVDDSGLVHEPPAPSHAYIDLRGVVPATKSRKRRARSELAHAATVRKRQHPRTRT